LDKMEIRGKSGGRTSSVSNSDVTRPSRIFTQSEHSVARYFSGEDSFSETKGVYWEKWWEETGKYGSNGPNQAQKEEIERKKLEEIKRKEEQTKNEEEESPKEKAIEKKNLYFCEGCTKEIKGEALERCEKKWHSECYKCSWCHIPLQPTYQDRSGCALCVKCSGMEENSERFKNLMVDVATKIMKNPSAWTQEKVALMKVLPKDCRILLLGQAGAGKTTLINELVGENQSVHGANPQTKNDVAYSYKSLQFVDTAGLETFSKEEFDNFTKRLDEQPPLLVLWVVSAVARFLGAQEKKIPKANKQGTEEEEDGNTKRIPTFLKYVVDRKIPVIMILTHCYGASQALPPFCTDIKKIVCNLLGIEKPKEDILLEKIPMHPDRYTVYFTDSFSMVMVDSGFVVYDSFKLPMFGYNELLVEIANKLSNPECVYAMLLKVTENASMLTKFEEFVTTAKFKACYLFKSEAVEDLVRNYFTAIGKERHAEYCLQLIKNKK